MLAPILWCDVAVAAVAPSLTLPRFAGEGNEAPSPASAGEGWGGGKDAYAPAFSRANRSRKTGKISRRERTRRMAIGRSGPWTVL